MYSIYILTVNVLGAMTVDLFLLTSVENNKENEKRLECYKDMIYLISWLILCVCTWRSRHP